MNVVEKAEYGLLEPVSNCLAWLVFSLLQSNSGLDSYFINSSCVFYLLVTIFLF